MPFAQGAHSITVDHSSLFDIQGDYYGSTKPGEEGIIELRRAACPGAFHDSLMRYPPPQCHLGTRESVLEDIFEWIFSRDERVMWLSGPAGAGKSAIAQTVSETCAMNKTLLAAFFFLRGADGRGSTERLIASIAYQLAISIPGKRTQLGKIVENDPLIFTKSLVAQIQALLVPLFLPDYGDNPGSPIGSQHRGSLIIIIDGLDECSGDANQREVVKQIGSLVNTDGIPFRFLISSRPEPQIAESVKRLPQKVYHLSLSDKVRIIGAKDDIRGYLNNGFEQIYRKRYETLSWVSRPWPSEEVVDGLVSKSAGMFIYAATVLKYVDDDDHHPANRLEEIIHVPRGTKPFAELDLLYQYIMSTCKDISLLFNIFTLRLLGGRKTGALEDGFSTREIEFLLDLRPGTVSTVLRRMHSLLYVNSQSNITFHHASFQDFIHNRERAGEYTIERESGHCLLAQVLLRSIARSAGAHFGDDLLWVYEYALTKWPSHCVQAGSRTEWPCLVEELSKILSAPPFFLGNRRKYMYEGWDNINAMLKWLEVDELQPGKYTRDPLDIQYQLFNSHFHEGFKFDIFIFYEGLPFPSASKLLEELCVFSSYGDHRIHLASEHKSGSNLLPTDITIQRLTQKLIEEHGDHIVKKGHRHILRCCLNIINKGCATAYDEPREYSYARKHWVKHLQHVPTGDLSILGAIHNLNLSNLRRGLTAEEITVINNWLRETQLIIEGQGYKALAFTCF